nr:transcription initiation factor TFIID subunit 13 [Tanacetum cinerariifolium]
MMYGFGDDLNLFVPLATFYKPLPETVALVEDIVVEYVTDMVHKAQDIASKRGKPLTEDFLFLIQKVVCQQLQEQSIVAGLYETTISESLIVPSNSPCFPPQNVSTCSSRQDYWSVSYPISLTPSVP